MEIPLLTKILFTASTIGLAIVSAVLPAAAAPKSEWKIGTPIVSYWAGPSDFMPVNDKTAAQLRAGGWNLAWTRDVADLDLYHRYGLRVMFQIDRPNIDDPAEAKKLDELIAKIKNHPAMYAYYIMDEPGAGFFPSLGKLAAFIRQRDPKHMPFINLLPSYASDGQLQVTDDIVAKAKVGIPSDFKGVETNNATVLRYREHLNQFINTVKPSIISYDHYHFLAGGDGPQYFLNLGLVRYAAIHAGLPFLNIVQACNSPSEGWREPDINERRWLTYTSLAYGAQGIAHFRYDVGFWEDVKNAEKPNSYFWATTEFNREFVNIATQLQPLKSIGAYHCGTLPICASPLPDNAVFVPSPRKQELLLGYFGKSVKKPTHVVVVNLNHDQAIDTTLQCPGKMDIYHAPTNTWSKTNQSELKLNIEPGGGVLLRLSK